MAKVFMTQLGTHCRIGTYGEARYEEILARNAKGELEVVGIRNDPAIVPDEIADQLEREIVGDPPDEKAGKAGVPGRTDIRIERDAKPSPAPKLTTGALKDAQKGKGGE